MPSKNFKDSTLIKNVNQPTKETVLVSHENLPLSCPTSLMSNWSEHPKVYLPIEEAKEVSCYYCGTKYKLIE